MDCSPPGAARYCQRSERALNPPTGTVPLAQRGTQVAYYGLAGTLSHPGFEVVAYEVEFLGGYHQCHQTPGKGTQLRRAPAAGGVSKPAEGAPDGAGGVAGGEEALQIYFFSFFSSDPVGIPGLSLLQWVS